MKKMIQIMLDEDTAEFLTMAQAMPSSDVSSFFNSLLRQERFRQGYPAYQWGKSTLRPITSLAQKIFRLAGR